jgi:hypothetical protein
MYFALTQGPVKWAHNNARMVIVGSERNTRNILLFMHRYIIMAKRGIDSERIKASSTRNSIIQIKRA